MLQTTYEAVLQPNGLLQFLEPPQQAKKARRVLVTFTEESDNTVSGLLLSEQVLAKDWRKFAGQLKSSPTFEGDPVTIQQEMRNEWD